MRIGVMGYKGFVGSAIFKYLLNQPDTQIVGIDRQNYKTARKLSYDILINAAGSSDKRLANRAPKKNFKKNCTEVFNSIIDFPCKKYIYISSVDAANPSNYGKSKLIGENIVRINHPDVIILRLGGMVGPGLKKNMIFDILNRGQTFVSPKSTYQYIYTEDVAKVIYQLIKWEAQGSFTLCGDGVISGEEAAKMAKVELPKECWDQEVQSYNVNISKIKDLGIKVPSTREAVRRYIQENR